MSRPHAYAAARASPPHRDAPHESCAPHIFSLGDAAVAMNRRRGRPTIGRRTDDDDDDDAVDDDGAIGSHAMTRDEFSGLLDVLSRYEFGDGDDEEANDNRRRSALLAFAVSQGLRPAVGFEFPLETYCLGVDACRTALEEYFEVNRINLAVALEPMWMIYNTDIPLRWLHSTPDEDQTQWLGRVLGYWTPMTDEEFRNNDVYHNSLDIDVMYDGRWNFVSGFSSLEPIVIDWRRMRALRRAFDVLRVPPGDIRIAVNRRVPMRDLDAPSTAAVILI